MPAAMARAAILSLLYDVKNPVHKWAIAMLHPKTQFSDPLILAILKLDFDGMLGVVALSRITSANCSVRIMRIMRILRK